MSSRSDLFLMPVNDRWLPEFQRTVDEPYDFDKPADTPESLEGFEEERIWGTGEGERNKTTFSQIEPGDTVAFCRGGTFFAYGRIKGKLKSGDAGKYIWDNEESRYIYTLIGYKRIQLPQENLWELLGYDKGYRVQGFTRVSDNRITNIYNQNRSVGNYFSQFSTQETLQEMFSEVLEGKKTEDTHRQIDASAHFDRIEEKKDRVEAFLSSPSEQTLNDLFDHNVLFTYEGYHSEPRSPDGTELSPSEFKRRLESAQENWAPTALTELNQIAGARATELLNAVAPGTYPILDKRSRAGMEALGFEPPDGTLTTEKYQKFSEDIKEAINGHDLPEVARNRVSGEVPEWAKDLELADLLFAYHFKSDHPFTLPEDVVVPSSETAPYYWVNQSKEEIEGEYLRAPVDEHFYHDLAKLEGGDYVFSYSDGEIRGYHEITDTIEIRPSSNQGGSREYYINTTFHSFDEPLVFADVYPFLFEHRRDRYSPVNQGGINQQYLFNLSEESGNYLLSLSDESQPETDDTEGLAPVDDPDVELFREVEGELQRTGQVVFYGPPGTGKTYTADRFARWWVQKQDPSAAPDRVQTVTFHPSFSYEDFMEGLTADATEEGQVEYKYEDGIFKRIVEKAREDYTDTSVGSAPRYVLIIDEINRGDLSQIFGEAITQLEQDKRLGQDNAVTVEWAHSGDSVDLPPNLYIIGTMNTADRSIALIDAALRRRFSFIPFPPEYEIFVEKYEFESYDRIKELAGALVSGDDTDPVEQYYPLLALSIRALEGINENIAESELGKGKRIGHSYLLGIDSEADLVGAWQYDILPLLEEYYFGDFERLQKEVFEVEISQGTESYVMTNLFDETGQDIADLDTDALTNALSEFVRGHRFDE